MLLTKDQILSAADRPTLGVEVPEWNGDVLLCRMDGRQRAAYEEAAEGPYELLRATVVSICAVDEAGAPLFTAADLAALNGKSAVALDRVFKAAVAHNRLRKQDRDGAEKNSETASSAASSSDSPDTSTAPSPSCSIA